MTDSSNSPCSLSDTSDLQTVIFETVFSSSIPNYSEEPSSDIEGGHDFVPFSSIDGMPSTSNEDFVPPTPSYNSLDESDSDIIRAQMMAMATPLALEYSDQFYSSLKNIELSCSSEVRNICGEKPLIFPDIISFDPPSIFQFFLSDPEPSDELSLSARKLTASVKKATVKKDGLEMLKSVSDFLLPFKNEKNKVISKAKDTLGLSRSGIDAHSLRGSSITKRKLFFSSRSDSDSDSDTDSDSDSDSGSDSDEDESSSTHHHHHGHHKFHAHHNEEHLNAPPDVSFNGAIGFGQERDMCFYSNFDKFSTPCQVAVSDHFKLRQEYWSRESEVHTDPFSVLLWASLGLLGFFAARRLFGCSHHHRKVVKIMETIRGNPALKASVEKETGMSIPDKKPCGAKMFCRGVVFVLITLASAFLIAVSSLLLSVTILSSMMTETSEPPSVPVAIGVLLTVSCSELCLFFFILRGCRFHPRSSNATSGPIVASAPMLPVSQESDNHQNNRFAYYLSWIPSSRNVLRARDTGEDGYVALSSEESLSGAIPSMTTEMVSVPSEQVGVHHISPYTPFVGIHSDQGQGMAAAQPVSIIQMI